MDRRKFLVLAGLGVAGVAAGCSTSNTPPPPGSSSSPLPPPSSVTNPSSPDWAALKRSLAGELIRPNDSNYDAARRIYNTRFDGIKPQAVAQCRNPHDVQECLTFVQRYNLPLAVRAGGHSYAGWSTGKGLVIDVGPMNTAHVVDGQLVMGAGTRLIDAYAAAANAGVGIPAGSCPTVGAAGLTMGGGIGVLTRAWGLTSDNMVAAQLVTADGKIRDCDTHHNSDLFWALRGGGGGNFGVLTSLTLRARPVNSLMLFFLHWPWSQAEHMMHGWQQWLGAIPDELWSNLHLLSQPSGTPIATVGGTFLGDASTLDRLLEKLTVAIGSEPSSRSVFRKSYLDAMLLEAGCSDYSVSQCHLPGQTPNGKLARETYAAKSGILNSPLSAAGIRAAIAGVNQLQADKNAGGGGVLFDSMGGAVSRVDAGATAFVHRRALATAQYIVSWSSAGLEKGSLAWLRGYRSSMAKYTSKEAYQNYIDPDLTNWETAYYGANYPRLQKIKAQYDPSQVFRFPQSIRPS